MSKTPMAKDDRDIPELKREQLGAGVRGKYFQRTLRGSNVVVLEPEIQKAFPTSEAVNKALASLLAFAKEAQSLTARPKKANPPTAQCLTGDRRRASATRDSAVSTK